MVLHGQSYKTRDPGDLATGYPAAEAGTFNIGVLHTALTGDRGHAPYAPCHPDQLAAKGYQYWALGHVHSFERVRTDPDIVFPGNLQGRNIRETGPKGAALVQVVEGRVEAVDHVALDVVRWALVDVDLKGVAEEAAVHAHIHEALATALAGEADGRPLMTRVRSSGETPLHDTFVDARNAWREAVRAIATSLSEDIWIEKVVIATAPPANARALSDEFEVVLSQLTDDPGTAGALSLDLAEFLAKAPAELDAETDVLRDARAGQLSAVLRDAALALRSRLQGGEPA
ncbi:exonuclease SbcCD subunit D [Caulobacter sp. UC70_42]|uniref:metallophosphoesterase family protein n=1 Tax=Caulobacter sp. UC70_42 TaxID=3374551 RepID=UPI0037571F54